MNTFIMLNRKKREKKVFQTMDPKDEEQSGSCRCICPQVNKFSLYTKSTMWLVFIYIAYGSSQMPVGEQYCMYSDQENPTLYGAQPSTKIINNNVQSTFLWYKQR